MENGSNKVGNKKSTFSHDFDGCRDDFGVFFHYFQAKSVFFGAPGRPRAWKSLGILTQNLQNALAPRLFGVGWANGG